MLSVMGAVAEFERALLPEHQREGIAIAKAKAPTPAASRPCRPSRRRVARRLTEGESASALAREYGVSRATVYNTHMRRARRCGYMHHEIPTAGIARRLNNDGFDKTGSSTLIAAICSTRSGSPFNTTGVSEGGEVASSTPMRMVPPSNEKEATSFAKPLFALSPDSSSRFKSSLCVSLSRPFCAASVSSCSVRGCALHSAPQRLSRARQTQPPYAWRWPQQPTPPIRG